MGSSAFLMIKGKKEIIEASDQGKTGKEQIW